MYDKLYKTTNDNAPDKNINITPLIHGGRSSTIYRGGTPPLPLIVSSMKAIDLIIHDIDFNYKYISGLRDKVIAKLREYDKVKIKSTEVADILIGELYQSCNDAGITYTDKIYHSRKPKQEVIDLYNRFLLIAIDNMIIDCKDKNEKRRLETRLEQIKDDIHEGKCVWE